jgi:hypothetical protein
MKGLVTNRSSDPMVHGAGAPAPLENFDRHGLVASSQISIAEQPDVAGCGVPELGTPPIGRRVKFSNAGFCASRTCSPVCSLICSPICSPVCSPVCSPDCSPVCKSGLTALASADAEAFHTSVDATEHLYDRLQVGLSSLLHGSRLYAR